MYDIGVSYVPQRMALIAHRRVSALEAPAVIAQAFDEIAAHIASGAAVGAEECIAMFPRDFSADGEYDIRIAVVIADGVPAPGIELDELPACQVVRAVHRGPYADTAVGWTAIEEWMDERDLDPARDLWEVYVTGPDEIDEPITELLVPLP
ncbi:MAG: GyrI-like domain-containing protein [Coriobacteriia bacterium]|nr:GyrI-like domain-containing protein [Coriobacteriia bacterium]